MLVCPAVEPVRFERIVAAAGSMQVLNIENEEQAAPQMADADAFFGKLTPRLLAAAGKLRWVQTPTASLEHYMFPELVAHPCMLTNMRGLYSDVIADHVFGYITCFARNLHLYLRHQMEAKWAPIGGESERSNFIMGPGTVSGMDRAHLHLSDATLGVVGFGAIGREVGRRGEAFGMEVLAVDARPQRPLDTMEAVWPTSEIDKLLELSDFVVVCAPHTPTTAGMIGRSQFQRMRRTAYFINIGRGAIVKLDDLCASLSAGEIAGAALDVFEVEPLPAAHPLWKFENVILTPHVAACSPRIAERHLGVVLRNIAHFTRGEQLENVVDKAQWF